ncbi:transposase [Streptomyces sp. 900105245]
MAGKRRSYDASFREGAVRIVLETGKPAAEVAGDLGVHEGTLQTWVHRALVLRRFDAIAPDVLWWGDMTEIETGEGKLHLASVHDAFSRRVLGYAMGERHDASLDSASLQMAASGLGPGPLPVPRSWCGACGGAALPRGRYSASRARFACG